MRYDLIKNTAEKKGVAIKFIAEEIGMSETGLHAAIRNQSLKVRDLENIAQVLNIPVSTFFDTGDSGTGNIGSNIQDTSIVNNTGSNFSINTGGGKKEAIDPKKKEDPMKLVYWTMIEHLVNNQSGLMVKVVEEAPEMQPFIAKQNEFKLFIRQLNTLTKLTDNNILINDSFFDYFENPY